MKEKAASAAASLMALIAAFGAVFSPELERLQTPVEKMLLTGVSAVGLYTVFIVVRRLLLRYHYRKLLGRWYYVTREHEGVRFVDRNVAVMDFSTNGDGDIAYSVCLYPCFASMTNAVQGRRVPGSLDQRGSARSLSAAYDVQCGWVHVLFAVTYQTNRVEDCPRQGILTLRFQLDGTLSGEYVSQIWEFGEERPARGLSSGVMYATRSLDDLKSHLVPAGTRQARTMA